MSSRAGDDRGGSRCGKGLESEVDVDEGPHPGAEALFIGKLQRCPEVFVLDSEGAIVTPEVGLEQQRCDASCCYTNTLGVADSDEAPPQHLIEGDVDVVDCSSSDDESIDWESGRHWQCDDAVHDAAPAEEVVVVHGRWDGRRKMQARAQQCVVCLSEKEHTLVPPHHGVDAARSAFGACHPRASSKSPCFDGHRFCTDCWAEFLLRNSTEQPPKSSRGSPKSRQLLCPVCRTGIGVPDVWRLSLDLPASAGAPSPRSSRTSALAARCRVQRGRPRHGLASHCQPGAPASIPSAPAVQSPTEADGGTAGGRQSSQQEGSPQFWACRRAGPGAAWAASQSTATGPPVVRDGFAFEADAWVVPPAWRAAAFWFELWKLAMTVLLCAVGYVSALFAAAEVAASIVGDADHPGVAPLLVDAWDFAAALATEFAQRDGYID